jgi:cold shock CspA family protein
MIGIVRHWDAARGFGKVEGEDRRKYFAHREELLDTLDLAQGWRVKFRPTESPKGPRALDVRRVEAW